MTELKKNLQEYASPLVEYSRNSGLLDPDYLRFVSKELDSKNSESHSGLLLNPKHLQKVYGANLPGNLPLVLSCITEWNFRRPTVVFDSDFFDELRKTEFKSLIPSSRLDLLKNNPVYFPCQESLSEKDCLTLFGKKSGEILGGISCVVPVTFIRNPVYSPHHGETKTPQEDIPFVLLFVYLEKLEGEFAISSFACGICEEGKNTCLTDFIKSSFDGFAERNDKNRIGLDLFNRLFFDKLIYWLSDMPDAEEIREHTPLPRRRRSKKYGEVLALPEKPYVRVLGTEIGQAIRNYRDKTLGDDPSRTVRPHIRRAHWHTYGTGPGRKVPKLLWLHPIFVHATEPAEN